MRGNGFCEWEEVLEFVIGGDGSLSRRPRLDFTKLRLMLWFQRNKIETSIDATCNVIW